MPHPNPLADYQRMRDFAQTPEPAGDVAVQRESLSFVVQKHAARQLHYDFRLELDGTLKSWAVPKGPSLDPADKRMAVHVEDHPLSYGSFEGVIPPGHYGAGTVIVWDRGEWTPLADPHAGYAKGRLEFELHGAKLRGRWALVRMKRREGERQEAWLLIKERDAQARSRAEFSIVDAEPDSVLASTRRARPPPIAPEATKVALPEHLSPQLASLVDAPPTGAGWSWEIKFDGYRLLTRAQGEAVRCFTRNGHDWSAKLPALVAAVRALKLEASWLDGEIVVAGPNGTPDFQALQNAFDAGRTDAIRYHVFDLPFHAGRDLRGRPLGERREILRELLRCVPDTVLRFSESFDQSPDALLASARHAGLEGLIGKRSDAPYRSGRSAAWVKLKTRLRQEFVIGGFTEPKGTRQGIGALLLGVHGADGRLHPAGSVGSGFDTATLAALRRQLDALRTDRSPFADPPPEAGPRRGPLPVWVKPRLLAEVSFAQWTASGSVRHAVFHGLRADKPARAITREIACEPATPTPVKTQAAARGPATAGRSARLPAGPARITHAERVVDADSGVTKGELVEFYAAAAAVMLPHLEDRPTALVRAPAGVGGALFFQKHAQGAQIAGIELLDAALDPGHAPLLAVAGAAGLRAAAQMNVMEFHTWNAVVRAIDRPDRMVFDLDPGSGVAWARVRDAAVLLRGFLSELGLASVVKTSGGKGLHVIVPLAPRFGWETVKGFSRAIVQHVARVIPERFVAKSGPGNRVGKIYIDYLRNGFGATTVCAWSVRARPGLGVSVPVGWDELAALTSAAHWTVRNASERIAIGNTPWAGLAKTRQGLASPMKKLGFDAKRGLAA
jgi:bifunctional non-homologous end joining protein LigD